MSQRTWYIVAEHYIALYHFEWILHSVCTMLFSDKGLRQCSNWAPRRGVRNMWHTFKSILEECTMDGLQNTQKRGHIGEMGSLLCIFNECIHLTGLEPTTSSRSASEFRDHPFHLFGQLFPLVTPLAFNQRDGYYKSDMMGFANKQ